MKNAQGDVIALLGFNGSIKSMYTYDAWGNVTSITDSNGDGITNPNNIALVNPIRYRGYYYDTETGLYYVSSRYYDPETCRFNNADDSDIIDGANDHILENNLFAYCFNNPTNMHDPDGYYALALAGGGYLAGSWAAGGANFWNPVGWVILGTATVATVAVVGYSAYKYSKSKSDPYARPGQKKQNRERKTKPRQKPGWVEKSKPKPPKKHTPGKDHRKYK